jgi:hypothetical protein
MKPLTNHSDHAACHNLIIPLLGRWRVESGSARQLGLPVRCVDGSTGSKNFPLSREPTSAGKVLF